MALINPRLIRQLSMTCLIILIAAIFIGGEMPGAGALFPPPWDKVVHIVTYGGMAVLTGLAFPRRSLLFVVLLVVGVGACDEIHQMFLPGRQAGFDDLLADFVGAVLFLPAIPLLRRQFYAAYNVARRR